MKVDIYRVSSFALLLQNCDEEKKKGDFQLGYVSFGWLLKCM
jgi:hypothetical protein